MSNCCAAVLLHVYSCASRPLSNVCRSRHLPVPTFFRLVVARRLYSHVCAGLLWQPQIWIFVPLTAAFPFTSRHFMEFTFRR